MAPFGSRGRSRSQARAPRRRSNRRPLPRLRALRWPGGEELPVRTIVRRPWVKPTSAGKILRIIRIQTNGILCHRPAQRRDENE